METPFIIIFSVISFFALIPTVIFYTKSHRMKDLRTLRLGRLTIGFLASIFVLFNGIMGIIFSANYNYHSNVILVILAIELAIFLIPTFMISFVVPISIVVLTIKMWRRETHSLANLILPAIMFVFFLVDWLYIRVANLSEGWVWLQLLSYTYPVLAIYLVWQFIVFFFASWTYGRRFRKKSAKYHVVLGSGLINGREVSPLLANRIRAGIAVASPETILVFSGGQGADEQIPEAVAMQKYAVEKLGFPEERTLIEDQSRTTFENLKFSSSLIEKIEDKANEEFLFFSSDYHVFRAALFAAQQGLNAQGGIGGKTPMYFRLPAFIREFIAVMNSQRRKHIFWVGLITGIFIAFSLFILFMEHIVFKR
ncbi:YdcF family protein [Lactococcus garvieae]|jgi:uncharacterized SAM-binding protein YcdF (DUF218 family)|uniref:YdcF family protein n=1 Tax=Lactococcus garvieae TaxID=1363 RepID=UPI0018D98C76|nr:YdcF family protein [Lactococcus garvieae]QPS71266.1 YdcF family protein [Lactococcus garvieae]